MRIHTARFNIIFWGLLAVALQPLACRHRADKEPDVEATTLRFHLQANPHPLSRTIAAAVGRTGIYELTVDEKAFLSEIFIIEAALAEELGAYAIKVKFDRKGTWILDQVSTANKGLHIAIYSEFGVNRWLAAPLITRRIEDGVFVFTPDATREEAERIVRGLKNVASEVKKQQD